MAKDLPVNVSVEDYKTYLRVKRALLKEKKKKYTSNLMERVKLLEEEIQKTKPKND